MKNILLLLLFPCILQAQIGMCEWRTHLCYNEMEQIEETPNAIFGISDGALFSVNKEDNLIKSYSKINGQNDFQVAFIRYNKNADALVIAYENGNIDLLCEDEIENISDIKNKIVAASKTPNDIVFVNEYAYISCGIGIVVVNLLKHEITDTYIIGNNSSMVEVMSTAFYGDSIYALTLNGLYVAHKDNQLLVDYNNWHFRTNSALTLPFNKKMVSFQNNLFLLKSTGEVYSSNDAINWSVFNNTQLSLDIRTDENAITIFSEENIMKYNQSMALESFGGLSIKDIVYNSNENSYWIASNDSSGIQKMENGNIVQQYKPDGPITNDIINIKYENNRLFALTGAPWDFDIYNTNLPGAIMIFEDDNWKNISNIDVETLSGINFRGVTYIAVDKNDKQHYFVSTWGDGVYEFKNDTYYKRYTSSNSTLEKAEPSERSYNIDGVCFDNNNNLWMTNQSSVNIKNINSVKVLQNNGAWAQFTYPTFNTLYQSDKTIVTSNNFKWFIVFGDKKGGVFILDDKKETTSSYNHEYRFFQTIKDQDENNISIKQVFCIAEDLNDNVWIGTDAGPVIFKNVDNVFNTTYSVYRPKIPRDDGTEYADYLLEGEKINTIAIDGANRKWIGTASSGAYLMSEDGLETIQHFTKENSPLLSNTILSIAINNNTGEVFFANDLGLISYMSNATLPKKSYETLSVYPNPVRENFNGVITIADLVNESIVKITDSSGRLVYQTKSNGGIATWDGYTNTGNKASTGVYFVMVSNASERNSDDIQTAVGKILIVK